MRKRFKDLRLGERFYSPKDDGSMDLNMQLMKISPIQLAVEPPWEGIHVTPNVNLHNGLFNSVIISSPNHIDGYFDCIPDDTMVYPENLMC